MRRGGKLGLIVQRSTVYVSIRNLAPIKKLDSKKSFMAFFYCVKTKSSVCRFCMNNMVLPSSAESMMNKSPFLHFIRIPKERLRIPKERLRIPNRRFGIDKATPLALKDHQGTSCFAFKESKASNSSREGESDNIYRYSRVRMRGCLTFTKREGDAVAQPRTQPPRLSYMRPSLAGL